VYRSRISCAGEGIGGLVVVQCSTMRKCDPLRGCGASRESHQEIRIVYEDDQ